MKFSLFSVTITTSIALLVAPATGFTYSDDQPQTTYTLGAGAKAQAKYAGSDQIEVDPLLHIDLDFASGFFVSTTDGIGFEYSHEIYNGINWFAGLAFNYEASRQDKDDLKGMGKVKSSVINNPEIGLDFNQYLTLSFGANIPLNQHDNGTSYYISVEAPVYHTESDTILFSTELLYATKQRNQTYFGVTEKQSANTNFARYTPGSGLSQIDVGFYWLHSFDKHWAAISYASVSSLLSDSANSPIVQSKATPSFALTLAYTF